MLEKEDCMQALSGQIFMGMVSSQYQARLDVCASRSTGWSAPASARLLLVGG